MIYRFLAYLVVLAHIGFVLFVVLGGLWVVRRPRMAMLHLPALAWGVLIEWAGWICPLTPLENRLRELGGLAGYRGGFLESRLLPALYPDGLGRTEQWLLGGLALLVNLCIYGWVIRSWRRGDGREKGSPR